MIWKFFGLFLLFECTTAFISVEEVPSILHRIYAFIPPVRKGSDSRHGVGFRLGNHADFQGIVELGPQTRTRQLGNENFAPTNKREARSKKENLIASKTDGGKWLSTWSKGFNRIGNTTPASVNRQEMVMDVLKQLMKLYQQFQQNQKNQKPDSKSKNRKSFGKILPNLSDVEILKNKNTKGKILPDLRDVDILDLEKIK